MASRMVFDVKFEAKNVPCDNRSFMIRKEDNVSMTMLQEMIRIVRSMIYFLLKTIKSRKVKTDFNLDEILLYLNHFYEYLQLMQRNLTSKDSKERNKCIYSNSKELDATSLLLHRNPKESKHSNWLTSNKSHKGLDENYLNVPKSFHKFFMEMYQNIQCGDIEDYKVPSLDKFNQLFLKHLNKKPIRSSPLAIERLSTDRLDSTLLEKETINSEDDNKKNDVQNNGDEKESNDFDCDSKETQELTPLIQAKEGPTNVPTEETLKEEKTVPYVLNCVSNYSETVSIEKQEMIENDKLHNKISSVAKQVEICTQKSSIQDGNEIHVDKNEKTLTTFDERGTFLDQNENGKIISQSGVKTPTIQGEKESIGIEDNCEIVMTQDQKERKDSPFNNEYQSLLTQVEYESEVIAQEKNIDTFLVQGKSNIEVHPSQSNETDTFEDNYNESHSDQGSNKSKAQEADGRDFFLTKALQERNGSETIQNRQEKGIKVVRDEEEIEQVGSGKELKTVRNQEEKEIEAVPNHEGNEIDTLHSLKHNGSDSLHAQVETSSKPLSVQDKYDAILAQDGKLRLAIQIQDQAIFPTGDKIKVIYLESKCENCKCCQQKNQGNRKKEILKNMKILNTDIENGHNVLKKNTKKKVARKRIPNREIIRNNSSSTIRSLYNISGTNSFPSHSKNRRKQNTILPEYYQSPMLKTALNRFVQHKPHYGSYRNSYMNLPAQERQPFIDSNENGFTREYADLLIQLKDIVNNASILNHPLIGADGKQSTSKETEPNVCDQSHESHKCPTSLDYSYIIKSLFDLVQQNVYQQREQNYPKKERDSENSDIPMDTVDLNSSSLSCESPSKLAASLSSLNRKKRKLTDPEQCVSKQKYYVSDWLWTEKIGESDGEPLILWYGPKKIAIQKGDICLMKFVLIPSLNFISYYKGSEMFFPNNVEMLDLTFSSNQSYEKPTKRAFISEN